MNRNAERCLNEMGGMAYGRPAVANPPGIPGWLQTAEDNPWSRDVEVRTQERLKERTRIARELHDTLFQGFLGASLQLHDAVEQLPADSPGKHSLSRVLGLMRRVIDEGRSVLQELRTESVPTSSLEQALSAVQAEFLPGSGVCLRVFVNGQPKSLSPAVQEQVYQIAREALINALRHAHATSIEAEVEYCPRRVRVVIRDNGCGIDSAVVGSGRESHWGLLGMRERANSIGGQLRIWSRKGAGTEVEISVPRETIATA